MEETINLTPHPITLSSLVDGNAAVPPSGYTLRVTYDVQSTDYVTGYQLRRLVANGLEMVDTLTKEAVTLPAQKEGTWYIVSAIAFMQAKGLGRTDLICPDTDRAVKNEKGHVLSVPGYCIYE